jgi:hypothetical protein
MVVSLIEVHLLLMGIQLTVFVECWFFFMDLRSDYHYFRGHVLSSTKITTIQIGMATCRAL